VRDLNRLYAAEPALHARDCDQSGFRWVAADDRVNSVFAYVRSANGAPPVLAVSNFTPVPRPNYRLGVPAAGRWEMLLNTDAAAYGGSDFPSSGGPALPANWHDQPASLDLDLPPLATVILRHEG
jgi:1,4-alpha-glucan branching enzyme